MSQKERDEFDFFDPAGPPNFGMAALPVIDIRHMEKRLRDNIVNAERRLFKKIIILCAISFVAGLTLSMFL